MSNDVKWTDWPSFGVAADRRTPSDTASIRTAWLQLLSCVLGLAALAAGLPGPRSLLSLLADDAIGDNPGAPGASAQAAILATASLVVWVLLIWSVAVCAAAIAGRLPGAPGLIGRSILRRIAPAAAGRLVAAAVGVSLLAGTSACAVPAFATTAAASSSEAVSSQSPSTTSVPEGGGSGVVDPALSAGSTIASAAPTSPSGTPAPFPTVSPTDGVIASIVIDWPDAAGPAVTVQTTASAAAAPGEQTPTSPAPASTATASPDEGGAASDSAAATETTPASPLPDAAEPPAATETAPSPTPVPADVPDSPPTTDPTVQAAPPAADVHSGSVVVRGGDSLWSIAAHQLPPDSSDADIDNAWRAWYSTNEQVIGDNPDLIQPGQLLLPPNQK